MTGVLLSLALSVALAAPAETKRVERVERGPAPVSRAEDPLGQMALADRLLDAGRRDEALAVLRSAFDHPALVTAASDRLERMLAAEAPRRAWALGYDSLAAIGAADHLQLKSLQARLADPSERVRAQAAADLQRLVSARPGDAAIRLAAGDAWMRSGRPDRALALYSGADTPALKKRQAAAHLALGKVDKALRASAEGVPTVCRTARSPMACALALDELGFPEAGARRLSIDLASRAPKLRTAPERASGYATLGALEERSGNLEAAIRAWQRSLEVEDSAVVRRKLVEGLLTAGRAAAAKRYVAPDGRSNLDRTVQAAILAQSVNPAVRSAKVDDAIRGAVKLDKSHPIVAKQAAYYHLERKEDQAAFDLLAPLVDARADDDDFLGLYTWAALRLDRPADAVTALTKGLAAARTPQSFAGRLVKYAELQVQAAEADKQAGRSDSARERYQLALTPDPHDADRLRGLGGALWNAEEHALAEQVYRMAWSLDQRDTDALKAIVGLLQTRKAYDEAMRLIASASVNDAALADVAAELEAMSRTLAIERARDEGRVQDALDMLSPMLAETPGDVRLLKLRADLLARQGRFIEAAETYRMARGVDVKGDPYIILGEVDVLLALDQVEEARALIDTVPLTGPAGDDVRRADRAVRRREVARMAARGDVAEAMLIYQILIEDDPEDAWTAAGLAELYASHGQLRPALEWMAVARSHEPDDSYLARREVELMLMAGQLGAAQDRASALAADDPTPAHLALAREVERRQAIDRAAAAASDGDLTLAEALLKDQLASYPEDPDVLVAWALLAERGGDPEEAWHVLVDRVLVGHPTHPAALSSVAVVGRGLGRTHDVVAIWQRAVDAGAPDWVVEELELLELAARLDDARDRGRRGLPDAATDMVAEVERWYGVDEPRRQTMLGEAWLDLGQQTRAVAAFERARYLDPSSVSATVGLSQALSAMGDAGGAESVLQAQWDERHQPPIGEALHALQLERGRVGLARETLADLEAQQAGAGEPPAPVGELLELLALPSGEVPADDLRVVGPVSFDPRPADAAAAKARPDARLGFHAGVGYAGRPGTPGEAFLQAFTMPIGAQAVLSPALTLQGEVVAVKLSDGEREEAGTGGSVAAIIGLGGMAGEARIGSSPTGFTSSSPYTTWKGAFGTRLSDGLAVGIETARAPVTDSLTAWAGATDPIGVRYGAMRDTWVGGDVSWGGDRGQSLGVVGRVGHADGIGAVPDVPWRQGYLYGRVPLEQTERRQLWLGLTGLVLDHERQVDGFEVGQGGTFTPDLFWSALGRVEGLWGLDDDSVTVACASVGAGPQQVVGEQTLYLGPGTYLGYQLHGALKADLGSGWMVYAHGDYQGSFGAWSQTTGLLQLRYGGKKLSTPSSITGSPVHGPSLTPSTQCGAEWVGWTP